MATTTPPALTTIETISTPEGFSALADDWDALVRAMPRPSPFLLHGWLAEWWRHHGGDATPAIQVARRDGRLAGALPMVVRRRAGIRVAGFMGGPEAVLGDVLLGPAADADLARLLLEQLDADVTEFRGLPAGSQVAAALGGRLTTMERIEAPVLDLTRGWDAVYREKANAKKRNLHRRRRRQLSELGRLEVALARDLDELEPALEDAFRLHALRWEGRPDGSGFAGDDGKRFHRAALARLAEIDVPRIITLRLDGRAIAFHYYFALEHRMYVHRLAFDPALARWSPGLVNTLDAIEAASEEGLERVEFLGGGERYKLELADRLEPLSDGFGVMSSLRGRAYAASRRTSTRARLRLKRSRRIHRLYLDGLAPARRLAQRASRAPRPPGGR